MIISISTVDCASQKICLFFGNTFLQKECQVEIAEIHLTLGESGCSLNNDPKLAMGLPNSS